jgi:hypothetical protein
MLGSLCLIIIAHAVKLLSLGISPFRLRLPQGDVEFRKARRKTEIPLPTVPTSFRWCHHEEDAHAPLEIQIRRRRLPFIDPRQTGAQRTRQGCQGNLLIESTGLIVDFVAECQHLQVTPHVAQNDPAAGRQCD